MNKYDLTKANKLVDIVADLMNNFKFKNNFEY